LTNEQKAVLYAFRKVRIHWDEDNDWRGLFIVLSALRELHMLRVIDLLLLPGEFRELVTYTLKHGGHDDDEEET